MRPPPWLAFPPLLANSRCLAGSIAAKPRFEPPLLFGAIDFLLNWQPWNAMIPLQLPMLIEVSELPWRFTKVPNLSYQTLHGWNHNPQ